MSASVGRRTFLRSTAIASSGLAAAALIGCGNKKEKEQKGDAQAPLPTPVAAATSDVKRGGVYRNFVNGDPPSIDMYTSPAAGTRTLAAYTHSRLFRIDAQPGKNPFEQAAVGDLAESAETADGAVWTVKLRKGVKFQNVDPVNGRELTSDDVVFSWNKLTGPKSTLAAAVKNIKKVEAIDKYTLRFTHDAPNADFKEQLADAFLLWIAPVESDGKYDPGKKSIGTGPWILDRYDVSQKFVFKRNPDYFIKDLPYMDGVEQSIIPEYANQMAQFQAGNVFNMTPTASDVLPLRKQFSDLQWMNRTGTGMWGVFFAPKENDPTGPQQDERFRIAVSYAIDRGALLELLYNVKALKDAGLAVVTEWNNQVSVGMGKKWWLDPNAPEMGPAAKYFQYNPAEAKKLLSAMGLKSDTKITYQYTHNRYGATFGIAAEAILGQLTQAGFPLVSEQQDYNAKFITQTWQGRFKGIALGNFGGFSSLSGYLGEQIDDNPENRRLLHTTDILDLKRKQSEAVNEADRIKLVHELQKVNATNMYIVPTTGGGGTSYFAFRPQVRGIRDTRGLGGGTEQLANYWLSS